MPGFLDQANEWLSALPPDRRYALAGALLGGGSAGALAALTSDRRNRWRNALAGLAAGGLAGAGLGYGASQFRDAIPLGHGEEGVAAPAPTAPGAAALSAPDDPAAAVGDAPKSAPADGPASAGKGVPGAGFSAPGGLLAGGWAAGPMSYLAEGVGKGRPPALQLPPAPAAPAVPSALTVDSGPDSYSTGLDRTLDRMTPRTTGDVLSAAGRFGAGYGTAGLLQAAGLRAGNAGSNAAALAQQAKIQTQIARHEAARQKALAGIRTYAVSPADRSSMGAALQAQFKKDVGLLRSRLADIRPQRLPWRDAMARGLGWSGGRRYRAAPGVAGLLSLAHPWLFGTPPEPPATPEGGPPQ